MSKTRRTCLAEFAYNFSTLKGEGRVMRICSDNFVEGWPCQTTAAAESELQKVRGDDDDEDDDGDGDDDGCR